jgi:hypothetical protein
VLLGGTAQQESRIVVAYSGPDCAQGVLVVFTRRRQSESLIRLANQPGIPVKGSLCNLILMSKVLRVTRPDVV